MIYNIIYERVIVMQLQNFTCESKDKDDLTSLQNVIFA